jgi:hypothetical protein
MSLGLRVGCTNIYDCGDRLVRIEPGLANDAAVIAQPMATVVVRQNKVIH